MTMTLSAAPLRRRHTINPAGAKPHIHVPLPSSPSLIDRFGAQHRRSILAFCLLYLTFWPWEPAKPKNLEVRNFVQMSQVFDAWLCAPPGVAGAARSSQQERGADPLSRGQHGGGAYAVLYICASRL